MRSMLLMLYPQDAHGADCRLRHRPCRSAHPHRRRRPLVAGLGRLALLASLLTGSLPGIAIGSYFRLACPTACCVPCSPQRDDALPSRRARRAAQRDPTDRPRRSDRDRWPLGLRQVDADQAHSAPVHPTDGAGDDRRRRRRPARSGLARRQIGVVLQENILFNRTIHENIALGDAAMPRVLVMQAARLAGADEFIAQLPQGYDTMIEERRANLSGGQRQRIAIARALATSFPRCAMVRDCDAASRRTPSRRAYPGGYDRAGLTKRRRSSNRPTHRLNSASTRSPPAAPRRSERALAAAPEMKSN